MNVKDINGAPPPCTNAFIIASIFVPPRLSGRDCWCRLHVALPHRLASFTCDGNSLEYVQNARISSFTLCSLLWVFCYPVMGGDTEIESSQVYSALTHTPWSVIEIICVNIPSPARLDEKGLYVNAKNPAEKN